MCLGDSDLSRLILDKTLVRSGVPDTLQEYLDLHPLRCSPLTFGVMDLECCDTSCTFEFLLEHPLKRAASDAGQFGFFEICSFPFPTVFRTADVGGLRLSSAGLLMRTRFIWESSTRVPSILPTIVMTGVGPLSGKWSAVIVVADADSLPQTLVDLWMAYGSGL
ncbi:hypothetical protein Tco_0304694 [Tanacetum coccineum]